MAHQESGGGCSHIYIQGKKLLAEGVYQQEVARWENEKKSNTNGEWVSTVVEAGTIRDKVNGLVLLIQQSPFHRLATLDQLIAMAQSSTTRVAILAIESTKSLFFASYLPDTKLAFFGKHFETMSEQEAEQVEIQQLVRWYYEDAVKARYAAFIQCLEKAAHSSLHESKSVAIGTLQKLLIDKPEQEHAILSILVNKMGDPHSKTATWTTNLLLGVLAHHPQMKLVIAREVQLFINKHSPLTTTIPLSLLSHIVLTRGETELANMLVSTYFRQLKDISERKMAKRAKKEKKQSKKGKDKEKVKQNTDEDAHGEGSDSKMASVLLTGVNRAFPYSQLPQDVYESHVGILFDIVEHGSFNRKVLGLAVIFKVIKQQQEISDNVDTLNRTRFYHLLYDVLLSTELSAGFGQPNYKQTFFALVEGAIAADKDAIRARAFVKRLLAMSAHARAGFACSSILIAARLFKENTALASMVSSTKKPHTTKPDPLFHAEGNSSCAWELCALRCHHHPLVARWARMLCANHPFQYAGDPLSDLSTNMFLSRFQNKQPSTKTRAKGKVKEMQPRHSAPPVTFSFTIKDFQTKQEKDIRPDELFFFKYLQLKIRTLEREDPAEAKKQKREKKREKKEREQVSTEALEELLGAEAEDGNFGMEGQELGGDDESDSDDDVAGGFGTFAAPRGQKRKGAPEKETEKERKKKDVKGGKKGGRKEEKKGGKKGKKGTKKDKKAAKKSKKSNSKRQKIK